MEILSPAGSPEALRAAVCAGADAVYLGYGPFNARRNAKNFTREELAQGVEYAHLRGVKVYLTLNTLTSDRELAGAAQVAAEASQMGVDAVLIQDMGLVGVLGQVAPDLPIHASTQMTVHNLDGVKRCADLGMTRAVLSRELSRRDIAYICERSPIEIETFVHGALCMCYSGQCFFSSVIGGRSGNRGLCAQPCRLSYGWKGKADSYPLSLKDMSLAGHLKELEEMGVACAKIEGRMKRPEYVWVVTKVYADALREGREPTAEELAQLTAAFSRQGFTDGYFMDQKGPEMFGTRQEQPEPKELFAQARAAYERGGNGLVDVTFYAMVRPGEPVQVGVEDPEGRVVTAAGQVPEEARTRAITAADVEGQLSKTGGTPYRVTRVRALVEEGLSVPLSALNALRRQVLEELSAQRLALPERRQGTYEELPRTPNPKGEPELAVSLRRVDQLTPQLLELGPKRVELPLEEMAQNPQAVEEILKAGVEAAVVLPRIVFDREGPKLKEQLEACRAMGITQALVGNLGLIDPALEAGYTLRGDYGLQVFNSRSIQEYRAMGFVSLTPSFELKLAQIRDLSKDLPLELVAYGRLPLMITENCAMKNGTGKCVCGSGNALTDRKGAQFPVMRAWGCRNEIFNGDKLFLADRSQDWKRAGVDTLRLLFTTETDQECLQVTRRYLGKGTYSPTPFTRGLYYRDVE